MRNSSYEIHASLQQLPLHKEDHENTHQIHITSNSHKNSRQPYLHQV